VALFARLGEAACNVVRIRRCLERRQMAARTLRGCCRKVASGSVTLCALQRNMRPSQREDGLGVVKRCGQPASRGVALLAGLREPGRSVVRISRLLERRKMTSDALRRRRGIARSWRMALRALHGNVLTGQWERRLGVIKAGVEPGCGGVALFASLREPGRYVVRGCGLLEVGQMASHTLRGSRGVVAALRVALRTLHGNVRPGQRERRLGMIKTSVAPICGAMALFASLRDSVGRVLGIGGGLEGRQVARDALRGQAHEHAAGMALRALRAHVRAGERKLGHGVVIKLCTHPGDGAVAGGTFLRKTGGAMRRVLGTVKVLQMATHASGTSTGENVVGVASRAFQLGVRSSQRKARELEMVKLRAEPAVHRMALLAVRPVADLGVAGIVGSGILG